MKVYELLNEINFDEVFNFLKEEYETEYNKLNYDLFKQAFNTMKNIKVDKTNPNIQINIEKIIENNDEYDETYYIMKNSESKFSFEFNPWSEILSYRINPKLFNEYDENKIFANIFYEMTTHGYNEENIKEVGDDLIERSKEVDEMIKNGTIHEHTIDIFDMVKELIDE